MIYFLEDDASIRELVIYTLNSTGFAAEGFERPSEFWKAMGVTTPRLILLDIMLPEEDGISILRRLRSDASTAQLPVVMLTAKGSEYDKVLGLDMGADDYIPKPFGMMELVARVRALLRRTEPVQTDSGKEYHIGSLTVSRQKHTAALGDRMLSLTLKEFELLCFLLENRGIAFSRDKLLNEIWGYSFDGESRTVDVHIRSLRTKLGSGCDIIETVRGVGYKII